VLGLLELFFGVQKPIISFYWYSAWRQKGSR